MCEEYCGKASWWLQAKDAPMIEKSWAEVNREEQEYFALASDLAKVKIGNIGIVLERFGKEQWRVLFGQKVSEVWREDLRPIDADSKSIR